MQDQTIVQSDYPPMGDATQVIAPGAAPTGYGYDDRTQQAVAITCPVCSTPNGPGTAYCQDCGLMFGSTSGNVEPLPDSSQLPRLLDAVGGREFYLNPGANSVGRESADVVLPDPTVSRRHAQITLETGKIVVTDAGSTNGSFVGGRAVRAGETATAYDGDTVRFGNVNLTLALPGGGGRAAEAAPAAEVAAPAPAVDRGPQLARISLGDAGEFPLYEGVNTIGRRSSNEIVMPDAFASGRHAEITCDADGVCILTDLGSTNGSFVNGERISANTPVPLFDGMGFRLAKTEVTFFGAAASDPDTEATMMAPPPEEEPASEPSE